MDKRKVLLFLFLKIATCIICCVFVVIAFSIFKGANFPLVKFHYWKGYFSQRQGNLEYAILEYNEAIKLDQTYPTAYISRGSAYLDLQKYNEAIADYTMAIRLLPENSEAFAYRGRAYYETDSLKKSLEDYNKSIILDNDFAYAYCNRGLLKLYRLEDSNGGCKDLKQAVDLGDTYAKEHFEKEGNCD